ncbi:MAG TPA: SRPBCC family protein [Cytophagaceae bacterium]
MKKIRLILYSIIALLLLFVIGSLFLPSQVHIERTLTIKASDGEVFNQVNNLKNWEKWSPWHQLDPNIKITYSEPASGEGAYYSWTSEDQRVGEGKLTIKQSIPAQLIVTEMDFMKHGKSEGKFTFEKTNEGTKITWSMDTNMGMHPVKKYFGLFMKNMVGDDFEKGLNTLKKLME